MKNIIKQEIKTLEDIVSLQELPIYFKHLTEIAFSEANTQNVIVTPSNKHQTDKHKLSFFFKPIVKIHP